MVPPRAPIFLARATYRRRRLIDALRLLPAIGLILFLSPLVGGTGYLRSTAEGGLFVFVAWFALIVATWGLGRLLAHAPGSGDPLEPETILRQAGEESAGKAGAGAAGHASAEGTGARETGAREMGAREMGARETGAVAPPVPPAK